MAGSDQKNGLRGNGFTLLEVMVALAILALSFTSLLLVQSRTTNIAIEARDISIATQLARYQLHECTREVEKIITSASDFKSDGDFSDEGYEKFRWECHAPKFNMKTPSASAMEETLKQNTPDSQKKNIGAGASVSAPFIGMITDSLGNSVRELTVIIRWGQDETADEMRVVTHVIDLSAMSALSRMLAQGAKTFEKSFGGKSKSKPQPNRQGSRAPQRERR